MGRGCKWGRWGGERENENDYEKENEGGACS